MTRDEERRLEIAEMFAGLSVFDRHPIGYMLVGTWLAPTRPRHTPEERRRVRAARENARYHALTLEEKRERNRRQYEAMKMRPASLAKVRERNRAANAKLRAEGRSGYMRMTPDERRAQNAATYAARRADPVRLEEKRAQNREYMREKRARLRAQAQAAE